MNTADFFARMRRQLVLPLVAELHFDDKPVRHGIARTRSLGPMVRISTVHGLMRFADAVI